MKSVGLFLIFELGLLGIELYLRGRQVRLLYGLPGCAKDLSASADTDVREDRAVYFFFFLFFFIFLSFCFSDWMSFSAIYLRLLIFSLLHLGCC